MILLNGIILGLLFGWLLARRNNRKYAVPELKREWLVWAAFAPQFLAFYYNPTRQNIDETLASAILILSQAVLLIFVWNNRQHAGLLVLGFGLLLNLLVITANGGWMPILPDTVHLLRPDAAPGSWEVGARLGFGKDIVLNASETRLWWLSDRFFKPAWIFAPAAFSLGDVFISLGAFLFLTALGMEGQIYSIHNNSQGDLYAT